MSTPIIRFRTNPPRTILIVCTQRIGDVLLSTPLARSLKSAWPDSRIDYLVLPGTEGILDGNMDIHNVLVFPQRVSLLQKLGQIRRVWGRYDLDLTPLDGWGPRDADAARLMPQLELLLERLWRRLAWRQLAGYPFKLGATLSYLVLQELEIRDLVTLLEGKAMGWNLERLNQYLIRGEE